ncbi:MAG: hypothetical protein Q8K64_08010 [Sediminibacterium sp.]|nr:hypothetical protein [Sediminibacterium sp.]
MEIFIFILIIIIGLGVYLGLNQRKKIRELKKEYDQSLRGKDKKRALDAGRAYYSAIRGFGKLTIYDEQAITNDLSSMN